MAKVMLAVGTRKGLFLGRSDNRLDWEWEGPHQSMAAVAAVAIDTSRSTPRILVGGRNEHWGPGGVHVRRSRSVVVEEASGSISFPKDAGADLEQIWQLRPAPDRPAGRSVGRRRAVGAVPVRRRRPHVHSGAEPLGSPAPPRLATWRRRSVPAHHGAAHPKTQTGCWWRCPPAVSM